MLWLVGEVQGSSMSVPTVHSNSTTTSSSSSLPGASYVGAIVAGGCKCASMECSSGGSGSSFMDMCASLFVNGSAGGCASSKDFQPECNTQSGEGDRLSPVFTMWITMIMLYLGE